jgi:hypothetical protein
MYFNITNLSTQVALERFKKMYKNDPDAIREKEKNRIWHPLLRCDKPKLQVHLARYDSAPVAWRCLAP